jgi:protein-S-isoprenylcysteine O-methyltransferase Ste14
MLSFAAIVIFMLFRRLAPVAKTQGIFPRVAAIVGTYLCVSFVLLPHHTGSWQMQLVSLLFMLGGEGFAIYSISWLGRSFSIMPEARCLVTGGPYAIVRHPLYLGEQIALFGVLLQYASPAKVAILAVALFALQFTFQLVRMGNEEQVLSTAYPEYAFYKMRTARILPGIY